MTNALVTLVVKLVLILLIPLIIVGGSVALMVGLVALFRVVEKRVAATDDLTAAKQGATVGIQGQANNEIPRTRSAHGQAERGTRS
jgi:hypothetical protein